MLYGSDTWLVKEERGTLVLRIVFLQRNLKLKKLKLKTKLKLRSMNEFLDDRKLQWFG